MTKATISHYGIEGETLARTNIKRSTIMKLPLQRVRLEQYACLNSRRLIGWLAFGDIVPYLVDMYNLVAST